LTTTSFLHHPECRPEVAIEYVITPISNFTEIFSRTALIEVLGAFNAEVIGDTAVKTDSGRLRNWSFYS
jgi:hypothetical protein